LRLWRISVHNDLKGIGGQKANGRWHHKGLPVVYLGESAASCLLEFLVHFEEIDPAYRETFRLLRVNAPDDTSVRVVDQASLPEDWRNDLESTRSIGDEWLKDLRALFLVVPSAICPDTFNWLLNPAHPDAVRVSIIDVIEPPLDPRLIK
jgi:RES domain-containing protein